MTQLISQEQDRPLTVWLRLRMRLHYGICVWCERYKEHLRRLREVSRQVPENAAEYGEEKLRDEAKDRMKRALQDSGDRNSDSSSR